MSDRKLSEANIARQLAEHTAKRVTSRVITALQRLTDCKLSGDDSVLENTWDEICVQVQFEESFAWEAYKETACAIIGGEVENLLPYEREALWLQTEPGSDWDCEDETERPHYPICNDDIVNCLWHDHVLREAGNWSNERVRTYIERSTSTD